MIEEVEIFSATDPPHLRDRKVRHYLEFRGQRSEALTEHAPVLAHAKAIQEKYGAVLIDRSDKDSGYLPAGASAMTFQSCLGGGRHQDP